MAQSAKHFANALNRCLDDIDAPASLRERANILSKMLDLPKHQAWSLLEGQVLPEQALVNRIAGEFEIDPKSLTGEK